MRVALAVIAGVTLACGTTTPAGNGTSSSGGAAGSAGTSGGTVGGTSGSSSSSSNGTSSAGASSSGSGTTSGGASTGSASSSSGGSSTGGCPSGAPSSCTPGQAPDPCAPYGYVCTLQSDFSGACELPRELEGCLPCVGCSGTPLQCLDFAGTDACVRTCTTTADCPDTLSTCQAWDGGSYCLYDACDGASYGSCNAIGTGDGTCLPFNGAAGPVGICLQDGQANAGACSTVRASSGDVSASCVPGQFCFPTEVGSTQGECESLCASSGPSGPSCGSGDYCWDIDSAGFDWGICLQSCTGNVFLSNCPSGEYCVNTGTQNGCLPYD